ncbi:MAG: SPOR domain-containing protein [Rhodocyclales bacterium]|nr:SPOR domain-containing protein [Rhodocyclales bacterium]
MAEQDTSADADLQLKKRARRRLVGAIALALLAVIVLPMVMDREPRPVGQDIQVRIPSQDQTSLAAKVMPGKSVSTPLPAPEPKTVAEPVPEVKPDAKPDTKPEVRAPESVATAGVPAVAKAVEAAPAAAKSFEKPAAKVAEKPAAAAKPIEKPLAAAKPIEKQAAKPAADAGGQWVVQLGAYKEAGNVKLLLSKLKGVNVPAYTEKYDSPQGSRTRVRAGPFPSQEAAEKARARIKIIGVDGPVAPK